MLVGYMRVSSDSDRQTTDPQRDALLSAGVDSRHLTNLAAGDTSVGSTPITRSRARLGGTTHRVLTSMTGMGYGRHVRLHPSRLGRDALDYGWA